jgi:hypothetical protein
MQAMNSIGPDDESMRFINATARRDCLNGCAERPTISALAANGRTAQQSATREDHEGSDH